MQTLQDFMLAVQEGIERRKLPESEWADYRFSGQWQVDDWCWAMSQKIPQWTDRSWKLIRRGSKD